MQGNHGIHFRRTPGGHVTRQERDYRSRSPTPAIVNGSVALTAKRRLSDVRVSAMAAIRPIARPIAICAIPRPITSLRMLYPVAPMAARNPISCVR